jgi:hypothetical protein
VVVHGYQYRTVREPEKGGERRGKADKSGAASGGGTCPTATEMAGSGDPVIYRISPGYRGGPAAKIPLTLSGVMPHNSEE